MDAAPGTGTPRCSLQVAVRAPCPLFFGWFTSCYRIVLFHETPAPYRGRMRRAQPTVIGIRRSLRALLSACLLCTAGWAAAQPDRVAFPGSIREVSPSAAGRQAAAVSRLTLRTEERSASTAFEVALCLQKGLVDHEDIAEALCFTRGMVRRAVDALRIAEK